MIEGHERTLLAAQGYCELGMFDDALDELESLPAEVMQHSAVVELRTVVLMQARRWKLALTSSRSLCRVAPDKSTGFIHAAFCLHELGRTDEARDTPALRTRRAPHRADLSLQSRLLRMRPGQYRARPPAPGEEHLARQEVQGLRQERSGPGRTAGVASKRAKFVLKRLPVAWAAGCLIPSASHRGSLGAESKAEPGRRERSAGSIPQYGATADLLSRSAWRNPAMDSLRS